MAVTRPIRLTAPGLRGPVACVDLETTGGTAAHDRIIEVGIVLLDEGVVVEEWSSLVNPLRRIPPSIEQFTGITNAMVEDAPRFEDVLEDVHSRTHGRLFVAHNARFDYGFLRSEFRRAGSKFSAPVLCTVRLSRSLFASERRHNLDTLIERHGLACDHRHRALGDAAVLPALLASFEAEAGAERVQQSIDAARQESRLPPQLPRDLADDLPDGPGVYVFRGEGGVALYVGMSRSLRGRVLGHFSATSRSSREGRLARQVCSVEWTETGGELGALLLESRLVKELAPVANRRLRATEATWTIRLVEATGALRPHVDALTASEPAPDEELYGTFRAERDAWRAVTGKAREAGLCLKVLGLEDGDGSCFAWQVGRCRGACAGREPLALHDARLRLALESLRIRPWPFPGPVGIRERSVGGEGMTLHVIDRWQHLGTAADEAGVARLLAGPSRPSFDPDSYRMLTRCLARVSARDVIPLGRQAGDVD
jgi:DNA polymerase-3 subunit epsilon